MPAIPTRAPQTSGTLPLSNREIANEELKSSLKKWRDIGIISKGTTDEEALKELAQKFPIDFQYPGVACCEG